MSSLRFVFCLILVLACFSAFTFSYDVKIEEAPKVEVADDSSPKPEKPCRILCHLGKAHKTVVNATIQAYNSTKQAIKKVGTAAKGLVHHPHHDHKHGKTQAPPVPGKPTVDEKPIYEPTDEAGGVYPGSNPGTGNDGFENIGGSGSSGGFDGVGSSQGTGGFGVFDGIGSQGAGGFGVPGTINQGSGGSGSFDGTGSQGAGGFGVPGTINQGSRGVGDFGGTGGQGTGGFGFDNQNGVSGTGSDQSNQVIGTGQNTGGSFGNGMGFSRPCDFNIGGCGNNQGITGSGSQQTSNVGFGQGVDGTQQNIGGFGNEQQDGVFGNGAQGNPTDQGSTIMGSVFGTDVDPSNGVSTDSSLPTSVNFDIRRPQEQTSSTTSSSFFNGFGLFRSDLNQRTGSKPK